MKKNIFLLLGIAALAVLTVLWFDGTRQPGGQLPQVGEAIPWGWYLAGVAVAGLGVIALLTVGKKKDDR